ncbi:TraR/DksA C4-type zinc finger protein [Tepidanaerobacter sp. GT38]|uniref:TraR/DksA C4-type zinc finger protein n=1 Tax=Tepidanaerobacter sp. GT38 TaxID=2722793 RepID=UPI001F40ED77|nr:TraR/DksA C4-type zinc finger protein [Tepidanaerobacter sp. GT38]MCG1012090.1 TraR/DksA C4-type zinc finger protein [Tepidanaerobacter sp. GT38]
MNLEYYKKQLESLKSRLEKQMESLSKRGSEPLKNSIGELSGYDNHPADLGAETFERAKDLGLKDNSKVLLMKVNHALDRISEGTYGICENCGKPISEERLKALPYTTLCIDCKKSAENQEENSRRPLEEEVLGFPFGRSFRDGTDEVGYDGEDAWQDVARYGTSSGPQDIPGAVDYTETYEDGNEELGIVEEIDAILDNEVDTAEDDKNELEK